MKNIASKKPIGFRPFLEPQDSISMSLLNSFTQFLYSIPLLNVFTQSSSLNTPFQTSFSAEEAISKAINDYIRKVLNRDE
jgi:hypothetical protein